MASTFFLPAYGSGFGGAGGVAETFCCRASPVALQAATPARPARNVRRGIGFALLRVIDLLHCGAALAALRPRVSILLKMAGSVGPGKYFSFLRRSSLTSTNIFVYIPQHEGNEAPSTEAY